MDIIIAHHGQTLGGGSSRVGLGGSFCSVVLLSFVFVPSSLELSLSHVSLHADPPYYYLLSYHLFPLRVSVFFFFVALELLLLFGRVFSWFFFLLSFLSLAVSAPGRYVPSVRNR